jgi:hypothetical protein
MLTADSRRGESLFLDGKLTREDLHLLLTAPTKLDVDCRAAAGEEEAITTTNGAVIRFGHLACGSQCVLKETEEPVVSQAVFTRLLNTIRPSSAPAVCHIQAKSVLMERGEPVTPESDAIDMLVQIVDILQNLQLKVRFRHGDLHWGNIVRVRSPVRRHNKHGNAFKPEPAGKNNGCTTVWFNMKCDWTYKLIDFEMSAIATERVVYEVPNCMYEAGATWTTQHDARTLVVALYDFWWLLTHDDRRTVMERRSPRTARTARGAQLSARSDGHGQWFARFIKGLVAYARSQSAMFDTTMDLNVNNGFRNFIVSATDADIREGIRTHTKWRVLWDAYPGGWHDLIGEPRGRVPSAHMQYAGSLTNNATTIFEPRNLMTMCCWYQSECNRQWHEDKGSRQPWSDVAFARACDQACAEGV